MADLFSIGSSALLAYSNALATTSNNIANVNTPGYTRQRVELQARVGGLVGDGVGTGVEQVTVQRLFDRFVSARLYGDASGVGRESVFSAVAGRVDQLLSDPNTGLSGALSSFFSAMDGVSASPADPAARTALIGAANTLADHFNQLASSFGSIESEISSRIAQDVTAVNGLAQKIADLNQRIALATAQNPLQQPNDLLDQREQAITELAGKIGVTTLAQDDGSINVFAAGHPLVLGTTATPLSTAQSPGNPQRLDLCFGSGANASPLRGSLGGELGGLIDSRSGVLDPAEGNLGRIAVALSGSFNQLQAQGVDLKGVAGADFFASLSPSVQGYGSNTGTATVSGSYATVGQLTGHDYRLGYDGTSWSLLDNATHSVVAMTGSGTIADPFVADGLSFAVSGSAAAGDDFLVRSTSAAAAQMQVVISDPAKVAAAAIGSGANSSDNTNARAMAALRSAGVLDGGTASFIQSYGSLVASTGSTAQQAKFRADAQVAIQTSDAAQRDSVSGVNLDEEAANMVRFQQAYQAAAQIIATANAAFDSLLAALRR